MTCPNILAIDPATKCGYAFSHGEPSGVTSGVWDLSVGNKWSRLYNHVANTIQDYKIETVAMEVIRGMPKSGGYVGSLLSVVELQGVIRAAAGFRKVDVQEYGSTTIKKHATDYGKATKSQMLQAARKRWPDRLGMSHDEADALWLLDLAITQNTF